jgi:hypothetical protein
MSVLAAWLELAGPVVPLWEALAQESERSLRAED